MTDRTRRRLLVGALLLLLGLLLLWALVLHSGVEAVRATLASTDGRLLLVALALFLSQSVTVGLRWWVALRLCGYEGRLLSLLRANSASNLINFLAPGHFGEPASAAWLASTGRAPGPEAFGLLVATKAVGTALNLAVLLVCLPVLLASAHAGVLAQAVLIAGGGLVFASLVTTAVLHPRIADWGTGVATSLTRTSLVPFDREGSPERRSDRMAGRVRDLFQRFRTSFVLLAKNPLALGAVAGMATLKAVFLVASLALVYAAVGYPVNAASATFIMSLDGLANIASVWIPGNLGLQEFVHSSAAVSGLAVPEAVAVSAALLVKGMMAVHALVGAGLWLVLAPFDRPATTSRRSRPIT